MKLFGLIGKSLKHSFSQKYFSEKFQKGGILDVRYDLFELKDIEEFPTLIDRQRDSFSGLNVTIPYKKEVVAYLNELDAKAEKIGAVNTIKFLPNGRLKGYNTDYHGFKTSVTQWNLEDKKALVLGTGGASMAVRAVLSDLQIPFQMVSRKVSGEWITYDDLNSNPKWTTTHQLIINTTPLGTSPHIEGKPDLPYSMLSKDHLLFDLVYNPDITAFMKEGIQAGSQVKNGYDMLVHQAEKSWEIWNS